MWSKVSDKIQFNSVTVKFAEKLENKAKSKDVNNTTDIYHSEYTLTKKAKNNEMENCHIFMFFPKMTL